MLSHVIYGLEIFATLCSCAFCLIMGRAAERAGAALILASDIIADLILIYNRNHFPTTLIFACDFGLAFGLLVVAVRYGSLWLGCAMVVQSVIICSEGMSLSDDGLSNQTQGLLNDSLSMVMLAFVVTSTVLSWKRRASVRRPSLTLEKTLSTSQFG